jgi:molecular chaperone GrpE
MDNHKQNHQHNHNHDKHESGRQEHKQPGPDANTDDAVDLDNLKTGSQQKAAEGSADAKAAANKAGKPEAGLAAAEGADAGSKAKSTDAEILGQKQKLEIDELKSKNEAANDKYLRLMAEFDNFKRRTAKEYQQLIEQANEKLIKDIIEVRENFERAFKHQKEGADPAAFIDGMKLNFTKLDTVLHKHGLEVYCEAGQEFNPELHDAMMKCAHVDIAEGHIAEVLEKGYKLKGKVIKHARVMISCGKPQEASAEASSTGASASAQEKKNDEQTGGDEAVIEVAVDKNGKEQEKKG